MRNNPLLTATATLFLGHSSTLAQNPPDFNPVMPAWTELTPKNPLFRPWDGNTNDISNSIIPPNIVGEICGGKPHENDHVLGVQPLAFNPKGKFSTVIIVPAVTGDEKYNPQTAISDLLLLRDPNIIGLNPEINYLWQIPPDQIAQEFFVLRPITASIDGTKVTIKVEELKNAPREDSLRAAQQPFLSILTAALRNNPNDQTEGMTLTFDKEIGPDIYIGFQYQDVLSLPPVAANIKGHPRPAVIYNIAYDRLTNSVTADIAPVPSPSAAFILWGRQAYAAGVVANNSAGDLVPIRVGAVPPEGRANDKVGVSGGKTRVSFSWLNEILQNPDFTSWFNDEKGKAPLPLLAPPQNTRGG